MNLLAKIGKGLLALVVILVAAYMLGPRVETPSLDTTLPEATADLVELEKEIAVKEQAFSNIKPGNEARIIWYDSIPTKTEYCIVYLHGWSASAKEGAPLHREMAERYGANLYLPRLAGHGLVEEEPMLDITADQVLDSAKGALAVAQQLGDKVIVMSTSTGGTLALHLAAGNPDLHSLVLYSPNVAIYDSNAHLLAKPWGLEIARFVKGGNYHSFEADEERQKYWTTKYRLEALTHLQIMVEATMLPETFAQVKQPVFMGYYFKSDDEQDTVVSVDALLDMFNQLGTPENEKVKVAFPNAGDHVIGSPMTSEAVDEVRQATIAFFDDILQIQSVEEKQAELAQH
jgi:esterase/lipase